MSYYYLQTSNDHLAHHGILGMKWGIRRYQPYEKGSKGGKEIGEAAKRSKENKKAAKQQVSEVNKAKKLEDIRKLPKARDVLQYADQLSTEDLINLNRRIKVIRDLEVTAKLEKHRGFYAIDSVMDRIGKIGTWEKNVKNAYRASGDILSILNGDWNKS